MWPAFAADAFLADYGSNLGGESVYPIGNFGNGNVVLHEAGKITVFFHVSGTIFRTAMSVPDFLRRIRAGEHLEAVIFDDPLKAPRSGVMGT
jgi:hypothetical protein